MRHSSYKEGPSLQKKILGNYPKGHTATSQHTKYTPMLMSAATTDTEEEHILCMTDTRQETIEGSILKAPLYGIRCDIKGEPT